VNKFDDLMVFDPESYVKRLYLLMETRDRDIELTRQALDLAAAGLALSTPNPLVGCVIVTSDGDVVGEGTYTYGRRKRMRR
jgi:tRNA(Arg) A34 adenosine deaminase TadA